MTTSTSVECGPPRVAPYGSGSPDPSPAAAYIAARTDRLQILVAQRPNVSYPAFAAQGERQDRALWTPTAAETGGAGNSTALVGTPETVAQALPLRGQPSAPGGRWTEDGIIGTEGVIRDG